MLVINFVPLLKYLQGQAVVPMAGNMPATQPPVKRTRSPSPTQCYYKTTNPSFSQGPTPSKYFYSKYGVRIF